MNDIIGTILKRDRNAYIRAACEAGLNISGYANPVIGRAVAVATAAHEGQTRRYTGEPYIAHPLAVARKVASVFPDPLAIVAAVLHDVVEDTELTLDDLREPRLGFGPFVTVLVDDLTDVSRPEHGNRAVRKAIDRMHTARAAPRAKLVKLADLIDNSRNIFEYDPEFAPVYADEKAMLLQVLPLSPHVDGQLAEAHATLYAEAQSVLDVYRQSALAA